MKQIFPLEIIESSSESHFNRHNRCFNRVYILIVALLLCVVIVLPFVTMEITTQSRGIVKTPLENNHLQSSLGGQIAYMKLREGMRVLKGDTLVILRTDLIDEQISFLNNKVSENRAFINDLHQLLNGANSLITKKYKHESIQYRAKVEEFNIDIGLLRKEHQLSKQLFDDKVTPELEYLQKKNKYEAALSRLNVYKKQIINGWQQTLTELEQANRELISNAQRLLKEKDLYVIQASVSGSLSQVAGVQIGSFITPGQALAQISPDKELIAECYIQPKDIGFIKEQQAVRLQFDAFNYNQWGMIDAHVLSVSEDVIVINNRPVFRVRCSLPVTYLQLTSGHKGFIKKGMTLTSRFVLTERTLYQLLFDKVDDWLNPKLVKKEK
ncbi:MAG: HlyD family efflux transporter periplasmic adaptor subunit [Carboxylicivirga sp.]|jgi:HlyD family secretion protein|nr:HlyD family efflux transporter periplasmic adaptor subunit [Carboxylicivirga sp.]